MKKMLILLTLFCLVFCVIFTACADISTQHTDADPTGESQTSSREETTESADTEETTEVSATEKTSSKDEVTETSSSETTETSATEETTESSTTKHTKPYVVCYTKVCETKELVTEIPELQEKIDRNDKNQGSDLSYHFQQKVILSVGDHRDVPYIFDQGGGQYFQEEYVVYPYFAGIPYFSELERNAEYMPTYIYTGTENVVIELNDEVLSANPVRNFDVRPVDGSERTRSFDTFEEIYEELPKGKYYVTYLMEICRNDIFTEYGEYLGKEHRYIAISFMLELSDPSVYENFASPSDEESAAYTVTKTDTNGLKLELTLHGYKSESIGKDFYVKNNEYFLIDVKLTNESENDFYQFLPTSCRNSTPAHNHEISVDISHGEYKLGTSAFGFMCKEMSEVWVIESGKTYEWQLKLAAGEQQSGEQDLPADGFDYSAGIKLYEKEILTDNIFINNNCTFDGKISFAYMKNRDKTNNDCSVFMPIEIEMVYVSADASK